MHLSCYLWAFSSKVLGSLKGGLVTLLFIFPPAIVYHFTGYIGSQHEGLLANAFVIFCLFLYFKKPKFKFKMLLGVALTGLVVTEPTNKIVLIAIAMYFLIIQKWDLKPKKLLRNLNELTTIFILPFFGIILSNAGGVLRDYFFFNGFSLEEIGLNYFIYFKEIVFIQLPRLLFYPGMPSLLIILTPFIIIASLISKKKQGALKHLFFLSLIVIILYILIVPLVAPGWSQFPLGGNIHHLFGSRHALLLLAFMFTIFICFIKWYPRVGTIIALIFLIMGLVSFSLEASNLKQDKARNARVNEVLKEANEELKLIAKEEGICGYITELHSAHFFTFLNRGVPTFLLGLLIAQ